MKYSYILLFFAIIAEIIATSFLKRSNGFTEILPTIFSLLGYFVSFFLLSMCLRSIPLGVAYAVWCGVGIVAISLVGYFLFKQPLDAPAIIGISMIALGVLVIKIFSKSVA